MFCRLSLRALFILSEPSNTLINQAGANEQKTATWHSVARRGAELRNANCDGQLPVGCTSSWLGFVPRPSSRAFARHTLAMGGWGEGVEGGVRVANANIDIFQGICMPCGNGQEPSSSLPHINHPHGASRLTKCKENTCERARSGSGFESGCDSGWNSGCILCSIRANRRHRSGQRQKLLRMLTVLAESDKVKV